MLGIYVITTFAPLVQFLALAIIEASQRGAVIVRTPTKTFAPPLIRDEAGQGRPFVALVLAVSVLCTAGRRAPRFPSESPRIPPDATGWSRIEREEKSGRSVGAARSEVDCYVVPGTGLEPASR